eukprot:s2142_g12.t1
MEPQTAFLEALASGAGFLEEQYDKEVSSAPYQVQAILQVRAHAYAMVKACHLGSWALYNTRFMEYYTRDGGEHYRFLTAAEAEEADQLALREVFGLCYAGASLDDALSTVAVDRDMLRHLLMPRLKIMKVPSDKEPLRRKPKKPAASDEDMNGECSNDLGAEGVGNCLVKDIDAPVDTSSALALPRANGGTCPGDRCYPKFVPAVRAIPDGAAHADANPTPNCLQFEVSNQAVGPLVAIDVVESFSQMRPICQSSYASPSGPGRASLDWEAPIPDGGGLQSTADWLMPHVCDDIFLPLRKAFEKLAVDWNLVTRLRSHTAQRSPNSLLSDPEIAHAQSVLVEFLHRQGLPCSKAVADGQPFLLGAWDALARLTGDVDAALPQLLEKGVPTGVLEPIKSSGVWESQGEPAAVDCTLHVHQEPWGSAPKCRETTWNLIQKDLDAGHLCELQGGEAEARLRWGDNVAAGKLGVVCAEGRKPRLIGDGTVSGTKDACQICEKVRLPNLESVQRFLSKPSAVGSWSAWSWDIRGAHKLVKVAEEEQGFSCFIFENRWFHYRSCYFGARRSAYWFSRVGAFIMRQLHRFIRIRHGAFLYVDDGLCLFPSDVAPLLACVGLLFMCAIGIPFSWEKMVLGREFAWLGWQFNVAELAVTIPLNKREKILPLLSSLFKPSSKVERKLVERVVGMLLWFTGGCFWLKPWLEPLYRILHNPRSVPRLLTVTQFGEVLAALDGKRRVKSHIVSCDVCLGWQLHSVNNCTVSSLEDNCLRTPRIRNGQISVVFFDFDNPRTSTCEQSAWAARLFHNAIGCHTQVPLQVQDSSPVACAADAFATDEHAGVGGWWVPDGLACVPGNVRWFSILFTKESLPLWFKAPQTASWQTCISAFEALAQLILLLLRCKDVAAVGHVVLRFAQLCDNQGVSHATFRMLSMKQPLCFVLQALGYYSCKHGVTLACSHIAGERNCWADGLSRGHIPEGFLLEHQRTIDVVDLLEEPWSTG